MTWSTRLGRKPVSERKKSRNSAMPRSKRIWLASNPNAPLLPEQMTLEELRDPILQDLERLRATGVLDLPQLPQGVVGKS